MIKIQIFGWRVLSSKYYQLSIHRQFSLLVVVGLETGEHMLWTPGIEGRIDFVGWGSHREIYLARLNKGECRRPHRVAWDNPGDFPLSGVEQNLWRKSACMIWKISVLKVNRSNFQFLLWQWWSTYRYRLPTLVSPALIWGIWCGPNVSPQNVCVEILTPKGDRIR